MDWDGEACMLRFEEVRGRIGIVRDDWILVEAACWTQLLLEAGVLFMRAMYARDNNLARPKKTRFVDNEIE